MNLGPIPLNKRVVLVLVSWQLGIILAIATAVLGPLIGISHGPLKGWLIGILAFVAAVAALIVAIRGKLKGYAWFMKQVYERVYLAGIPLLNDLKNFTCITDGASIGSAFSELHRSVLDTAIEVCGSPSLRSQRRAAIYELRDGSSDLIRGPVRGRQHLGAQPRERFSAEHLEDSHVVTWCKGVRNGMKPLVDYQPRAKKSARGSVSSTAAYESYIATPIFIKVERPGGDDLGKTYGLLALDSAASGDLVEDDKQSMIMLASILAAAYAHRDSVLGRSNPIASRNTEKSGQ
ncbi:GAF domain-containing protein [Streptomyces sp. NPDC006265]|uniref:GAF domain-containing protein n=1 Tax=Streptomyces sp. NPDC006265 TaxID=3156740 RepID=UPI0033A925F7